MPQESNAKTFEGIDDVKKALSIHVERMSGKEVVGFYAHAENITPEVEHLFEEYYGDEFKKRGITLRGIAPDHESLKSFRAQDAEYGRTMKIVPFEKYSSSLSIEIGDTYVFFFSFKEPQIIMIDDEETARTMRQIFELTWSSS